MAMEDDAIIQVYIVSMHLFCHIELKKENESRTLGQHCIDDILKWS